MKDKTYFWLIIGLVVLAAFSGCTSEPPVQPEPPAPVVEPAPEPPQQVYEPDTMVPLTPSIIYRLGDSYNKLPENIGNYQLALSGSILMESEFTNENDTVQQGGKVRFEDIHVRNSITIEDKTPGQGSTIDVFGDGIAISACFENDDKYRLNFATVSGDPEGYFYLKYTPGGGVIPLGDLKGTIDYGGETYKLSFAGDADRGPHLLITLTHQDTVKLNSRTAPGRRIN